MDLWGKIDVTKWQSLPHIAGRAATEKDVQDGRAVFVVPSGSKPVNIGLPFWALQISDRNEKTPVIAIQAEEVDGEVIVGIRYLDGGNGVCTLSELRTLESPNEPV
ncbi:hypothetical protein AAFN88_10395 [Pelagibius sp. CAU 1746]|uniref:hypothetical protein n=1 Tax=Pelagibius sp. CAU 1746 TaxID=3140370 RepID=UPI00325B9267